jgi:hypothetical protein
LRAVPQDPDLMRAIAKRDRLISFHSVATGENSMGEPVDDGTYPLLCKEWAAVIFGRGFERRAAAIEGADQPATFIVLANNATRAVSIGALIQFDGGFWDIQNRAPLDRREIEFTAVRRAK